MHLTQTGYEAQKFAQRVVQATTAPLLLVDDSLHVLAASLGYRRAFVDRDPPEGQPLQDITGGAWRERGVMTLVQEVRRGQAGGSIQTRVLCPAGLRDVRVGISATPPDDASRCALVMSIEDCTDALARDAASSAHLQEVEALLREARHRTANNLSMISSILALKARNVLLDETRAELESARRRVLALATIEHHLEPTDSQVGTLMRPYLEALCEQLNRSLIGDARNVALEIEASAGSQPRRTAVTIGLIVTELVINALKYAHPGDGNGRIRVEYLETLQGWCVSVTDDGCGLRADDVQKRHGGIDIVRALAAQIQAEVTRHSTASGLRVELRQPAGASGLAPPP